MQRPSLAKNILIAGQVFVFAYFGIDKFVHPELWLGWIPMWMDNLLGMPRETWLSIIGVSETLMAILLLIPVRSVRLTGAILIALHLAGIITQVGWNDVGVRDIGLLIADLALIFLL